jgi:SsrA-binding protein
MEHTGTLATNHKAFHNYFVEDRLEAGIALTGCEIKSIRAGRVSFGDAYVRAEAGEFWLVNAHVARYEASGHGSYDPMRARKLLLHRREIGLLTSRVKEKGLTLVPLRLYLKGNRAKLEIALGRGKKQYDKRAVVAKREVGREIERALKERATRN